VQVHYKYKQQTAYYNKHKGIHEMSIYVARDRVSQTVLINVYYAKFESVLKYGNIFWGGVQKDFKDIFKLQKRCIRVIKGVKNRVSCKNLVREFKILTGYFLIYL
jgi:hypothetical protein